MYKWRRRQAKAQTSWRRLSSMHEAWQQHNENKTKKKSGLCNVEKEEADCKLCIVVCEASMKKTKTAAATAAKKATKKGRWAEAAFRTVGKMTAEAKRQAVVKYLCGKHYWKEKPRKWKKQKVKTPHSSCYKKTWDQYTHVKESKKWYASSKATDGMQY